MQSHCVARHLDTSPPGNAQTSPLIGGWLAAGAQVHLPPQPTPGFGSQVACIAQEVVKELIQERLQVRC